MAKVEKPPDANELASLKDQDLEIKLCIEELLKETRTRDKTRVKLQGLADKVKATLLEFPERKISSDDELFTRVKPPCNVGDIPGTTIQRPQNVQYVGGFQLGLDGDVDLAVTMPVHYIHPKDYLKEKYMQKKSFYLTIMAAHLEKTFSGVTFKWLHGNKLKPVLVIPNQGLKNTKRGVVLHLIPPEGVFKLLRFAVWQSNLRSDSKKQKAQDTDSCDPSVVPTPHYNSAIAMDLTLKTHLNFLQNTFANKSAMIESIEILKIWLKQRGLSSGVGSFSNFILTMYVAYLIKNSILTPHANTYHIFRTVLLQLSNNNWENMGLSLTKEFHEKCEMSEFQDAFPVVFIDPTGYVNLCSDVALGTLLEVKQEATLAIDILKSQSFDAFSALFITKVPPLLKFDDVIYVKNVSKFETLVLEDLDQYCRNDVCLSMRDKFENLLRRAVQRRTSLLCPVLNDCLPWPITTTPPVSRDVLSFGLLLNTDTCYEAVEKGPSPEATSAKDFCAFWGTKAELRRFQDGICHAVYFPCETMHDRREVCGKMAQHILQQHFAVNCSDVFHVINQLDFTLQLPDHTQKTYNPLTSYGTGEEQNLTILDVLMTLVKDLNSIRDSLPLSISSVKGISPIIRQTEVFPPMANVSKQYSHVQDGIHYPQVDQPSPWVMPSFTILCTLEASGKWPENYDAVQSFKTSMLLQIEELLDGVQGVRTSCFTDHLIIMKRGFVFRLELAYGKEVAIMRTVVAPDGASRTVASEIADELEFRIVQLPKLTSYFESLPKQHSFSGAVRLAKRWLASQMFDESHIPDIAVELIVASIYVSPEPYEMPKSPLVGFLRFLQFMSTFNWNIEPLIVNFGHTLSNSTLKFIKRRFQEEREALPLMFIGTPVEHGKSWITNTAPTAPVLSRVASLAFNALGVLENQLSSSCTQLEPAFVPELHVFDVLIQLKKSQVATRHQALSLPRFYKDYYLTRPNLLPKSDRETAIPLYDYNPVDLYLKELRNAYGDTALFFVDRFGGKVIGVVWKPRSDKVSMTTTDKDTIIGDLEKLGEGLVLKLVINKK